MDGTATDDTQIEAAIEFILTLGVEDALSCGCFLLAAMKILSRSADFRGEGHSSSKAGLLAKLQEFISQLLPYRCARHPPDQLSYVHAEDFSGYPQRFCDDLERYTYVLPEIRVPLSLVSVEKIFLAEGNPSWKEMSPVYFDGVLLQPEGFLLSQPSVDEQ